LQVKESNGEGGLDARDAALSSELFHSLSPGVATRWLRALLHFKISPITRRALTTKTISIQIGGMFGEKDTVHLCSVVSDGSVSVFLFFCRYFHVDSVYSDFKYRRIGLVICYTDQ